MTRSEVLRLLRRHPDLEISGTSRTPRRGHGSRRSVETAGSIRRSWRTPEQLVLAEDDDET